MTYAFPSCMSCKHLHRKNLADNTCDAFHEGIPFDIMGGKHDHKTPYPGDKGIQYEPMVMGKREGSDGVL